MTQNGHRPLSESEDHRPANDVEHPQFLWWMLSLLCSLCLGLIGGGTMLVYDWLGDPPPLWPFLLAAGLGFGVLIGFIHLLTRQNKEEE